jgi:putative sugar O-methyltransferase
MSGDPSAFKATKIWEHAYDTLHRKAIAEVDDERAFIEIMTANNAFTYPRLIDDPQFQPVVDRYVTYLRKQDSPLESLPPEIEESPFVSKRSTATASGRHISTMFLHHLCMTLRISSLTTGLRKVIEIGGGYGGLARTMRLFNPHQTYIIVDLLDSLYCSYVFLSTHYPDAKMLFVTKSEDATGMDDFDFVFVPTQHFAVLSGGSVDLIVNTASFGEMLQRDVDAYMQFINYSAKARYFYSVNRYARYESDMSLADQANASVKLSPDWEILYWNAFGTGSFHQLDPHTPPQLELLARHIPADQLLAQARQRIAALLESSSRALPPSGSDWHFCMWEATRLFPAQPVIEKYIAGASPQTFRDADYYRELMETASPTASTLPIGVDLNAGISDKRSRGASVRDIRGWIGALFKR